MHWYKFVLISMGLLFLRPASVFAQKTLKEGVLIYKVTINPPPGIEGAVQYSGVYTIYIKGGMVRKELKLENGFASTVVTDNDGQKAFSLKKMGDENVAIQIDMAKLQQRKKIYTNFRTKMLDNTKQVAALNAIEYIVTYADNSNVNIFCADSWHLATDIFEHFPGIQMLPVVFTYTSDEGRQSHFELQRLDEVPVENGMFTIPMDVKIVGSDEYREQKGNKN